MRTARIIGSTIAAVSVLTLGLATPAAAKKDKCLVTIAQEVRKAGVADLKALLKSQTPAATLSAKKIGKKCPTLPASIGYTGCPGTAGCPADTDATVTGYQNCLNCIAKNALPAPTCGNGTKDAGEQCDGSTGCSAGQKCSQFCTCFTPPCGKLKFSFASGTTSCGGPALTPAAESPFAGAMYDATTGGTKLADLGLGCLYFGGGAAAIVSPGAIPDGAATILDGVCDVNNPNQVQLAASAGTGQADCTKGPKSTMHCADIPATACTTDTDCSNHCVSGHCTVSPDTSCTSESDCPTVGSKLCQQDPQCFFGPPLSLPNHNLAALSACVVNVLASDAAGTMNTSTGAVTLSSYSLKSLVYLTGNEDFACPACVSGTCNGGERQGQACTATATSGVTLDCPPAAKSYLGALDVNLAPLTTGSTEKTAADGIFCPDPFCANGEGACDPNDMNACGGVGACQGQPNAGAFGVGGVQRITAAGTPAGDLTDGQPHDATLAYVFCIPPPGEPATSSSDLPGPGAVSITGKAQFVTTP